jgi:hypothetical protein
MFVQSGRHFADQHHDDADGGGEHQRGQHHGNEGGSLGD